MRTSPRLAALLTLLLAASSSAGPRGYVPRVSLNGGLGVGVPGPAWRGVNMSPLTGGFANPHNLVPTLAPSLPAAALAPANLVASLAPAPALTAAHAAPLAASPALAAPAAADAPNPGQPGALESLKALSAPANGPRWVKVGDFDGARRHFGVVAEPERSKGPSGFIKNPDGVWVGGRVREQTEWISAMAEQLKPVVDLADVLDVMDDAYDESRAKLQSAERAAQDRSLEASSVHLEGTRNWVDAILTDSDGEQIAVHTHRVYFHPGRGNTASEISEGIRRVGKYIDKAALDFAPGGLAETDMDTTFKQVELNFDTRGYKEIEDYIRGREAELRGKYPGRFVFNYVTEPKRSSRQIRDEYNRLVERFADQPDGLMNIIDGVTYSRTVGVGHELNSHLKRLELGYRITQAGRDFFGKTVMPDGSIVETYKTEFDRAGRAAEGGLLRGRGRRRPPRRAAGLPGLEGPAPAAPARAPEGRGPPALGRVRLPRGLHLRQQPPRREPGPLLPGADEPGAVERALQAAAQGRPEEVAPRAAAAEPPPLARSRRSPPGGTPGGSGTRRRRGPPPRCGP
jgi:hypothetical protein